MRFGCDLRVIFMKVPESNVVRVSEEVSDIVFPDICEYERHSHVTEVKVIRCEGVKMNTNNIDQSGRVANQIANYISTGRFTSAFKGAKLKSKR